MGKINSNSSLFSFHIFLFSLFIFCNLITATSDNQVIGCSLINCGQGTCVNDTSLLGFDCECNSGWKKLQIGPLFFPSCILPNCTINLSCSNVSSPPPPPPASFPPLPHFNLSDPCALVWCGDGTCVANGAGHTCQCFPGAENFFNNPAFACLKQCSMGADCSGLGLGLTSPPAPPSQFGSSGSGSTRASNNSSKLGLLTIILLVAATIHSWF